MACTINIIGMCMLDLCAHLVSVYYLLSITNYCQRVVELIQVDVGHRCLTASLTVLNVSIDIRIQFLTEKRDFYIFEMH